MTVDCVELLEGAQLCTNEYTLTIMGRSGLTCNAFSVLLVNGGKVVFAGGGTMTLGSEGGILLESGSELTVSNSNAAIAGPGRLIGEHNSAKIKIGSGLKFENQADIRGALQILGFGSFVNKGAVLANGIGANSDTLEFSDTLATVDDADASGVTEWRVWAGAKLRFRIPSLTLDGQFSLATGGTLIIDECVATSSRFAGSAADVDVADDKCFAHHSGAVCGTLVGTTYCD